MRKDILIYQVIMFIDNKQHFVDIQKLDNSNNRIHIYIYISKTINIIVYIHKHGVKRTETILW